MPDISDSRTRLVTASEGRCHPATRPRRVVRCLTAAPTTPPARHRGRPATCWSTCAARATTRTGTTPSRSTSTTLAAVAGLSKYHFLRLFTATYGAHPGRVRLAAADRAGPGPAAGDQPDGHRGVPRGRLLQPRLVQQPVPRARRREPERVPAALRRSGAPHIPGCYMFMWGLAERRLLRNRGEATRAARRVLASSHDHQHLPRQRLREGHRRVQAPSTPTSSASRRSDDITLGDGYRWCTVVHPSQPELQVHLTDSGPAALRRAGRRDEARPGRGRHARARPERRRLPARPTRSCRAKGVEFLQPPRSGPTASRRCARQLRQLDGARGATRLHAGADFEGFA